MKFMISLTIIIFLVSNNNAICQDEMVKIEFDVIHLKTGTSLTGYVIEDDGENILKFEGTDGEINAIYYQYIKEITKQTIEIPDSSKYNSDHYKSLIAKSRLVMVEKEFDVIHLKTGFSKIGTIVKNVPNDYVKFDIYVEFDIEPNVWTIPYSLIDRFSKKPLLVKKTSKYN